MDDGFYWIPQQLWWFRKMPFGTYTICLHPNTLTARAFQQLEQDLSKHRQLFIGVSDVRFSALAKKRPRENTDERLYVESEYYPAVIVYFPVHSNDEIVDAVAVDVLGRGHI